ncbi:hypothetical protein ARMGADRAFT_1033131 [Armillaria gallica]|uniref:Uncharacterized protein n=1 Tax=Armillaria gallica TaxID=47427 RepID=A0A2H3DQ56_ARMGA|nr:hypothetical protein ARMGADRAFT_1033131 [Armillaria gallica]
MDGIRLCSFSQFTQDSKLIFATIILDRTCKTSLECCIQDKYFRNKRQGNHEYLVAHGVEDRGGSWKLTVEEHSLTKDVAQAKDSKSQAAGRYRRGLLRSTSRQALYLNQGDSSGQKLYVNLHVNHRNVLANTGVSLARVSLRPRPLALLDPVFPIGLQIAGDVIFCLRTDIGN